MVLGMIVSPLIIRYNKRIARFVLRERGPPIARSTRRVCGRQRPGAARARASCAASGGSAGNLARVLAVAGLRVSGDSIWIPANVRAARQAGEPVVWGDSADEELLRNLGLDHATVVIVTFADPSGGHRHRAHGAPPAQRCAGAGAHAG